MASRLLSGSNRWKKHTSRPTKQHMMIDQTVTTKKTTLKTSRLNPQYIDPEYGKDPYWDDDLYDRQSLQFRHDDYSSTDDEEDPEITATKLSRAIIELWQTNTEALHQKIAEECLNQQTHETEPSLLDEAAFLNILVIKEGEPAYIPLSTNLGLKFKRRMLYFPMDSNRITEN